MAITTRVVTESTSNSAINAEPGEAFIYSFRPECFDVLEVPKATIKDSKGDLECPGGKFYLPVQVRIVGSPGAGMVRTVNRGEAKSEKWRYVKSEERERGATIIDPQEPIPAECLPEGVPAGGYLRVCDVLWRGNAGERHLTPWDVANEVPGAPVKWTFNREKYALWLWWLVASGRVPAVHSTYVEADRAARKNSADATVVRFQAAPKEIQEKAVKEAKSLASNAETAGTPEGKKK